MTTLASILQERLSDKIINLIEVNDELTLEIAKEHLHEVALILRDETPFQFTMLIDLCGVDYANYGVDEWVTEKATGSGFERGVSRERKISDNHNKQERFAVVYHLLSITHNQRLRLRVFLPDELPLIDSVIDIWNAANWYEREAFDLFGIIFNGHPDLRRILTDYGFIGHPFRKDFPLSGNVGVRYDAAQRRVIYEPVDIEPRVLVPKVIRNVNPEGKTNG